MNGVLINSSLTSWAKPMSFFNQTINYFYNPVLYNVDGNRVEQHYDWENDIVYLPNLNWEDKFVDEITKDYLPFNLVVDGEVVDNNDSYWLMNDLLINNKINDFRIIEEMLVDMNDGTNLDWSQTLNHFNHSSRIDITKMPIGINSWILNSEVEYEFGIGQTKSFSISDYDTNTLDVLEPVIFDINENQIINNNINDNLRFSSLSYGSWLSNMFYNDLNITINGNVANNSVSDAQKTYKWTQTGLINHLISKLDWRERIETSYFDIYKGNFEAMLNDHLNWSDLNSTANIWENWVWNDLKIWNDQTFNLDIQFNNLNITSGWSYTSYDPYENYGAASVTEQFRHDIMRTVSEFSDYNYNELRKVEGVHAVEGGEIREGIVPYSFHVGEAILENPDFVSDAILIYKNIALEELNKRKNEFDQNWLFMNNFYDYWGNRITKILMDEIENYIDYIKVDYDASIGIFFKRDLTDNLLATNKYFGVTILPEYQILGDWIMFVKSEIPIADDPNRESYRLTKNATGDWVRN